MNMTKKELTAYLKDVIPLFVAQYMCEYESKTEELAEALAVDICNNFKVFSKEELSKIKKFVSKVECYYNEHEDVLII